jgi:hypothetical protein
MDGYSVQDAASVLGVPEARVWELIARGVLAGNPEPDGAMRVVLRAASAPATPNGGHEPELSPFRELLTEFRNLTERYGQALLALGESRGEVAALRSRVDLLEARVDLRLGPGRPVSTVAWEVPDQQRGPAPEEPEPKPEATTAEAAAAEAAGEAAEAAAEAATTGPPMAERPIEQPTHPASRARRRGGTPSSVDFADALARAQDPSLPELPGAEEAARAMAALRSEVSDAGTMEDEAAPLVEPRVAATASVAEFADELPLPSDELRPPVEESPMEESPMEATAAQQTADEPTPGEAAAPQLVAEPTLESVVESVPEPAPESVGEPPAIPADEPMPPAPEDEAPLAGPYTTEMVEPDWFADGDFSWLEQAQAAAQQEVEASAPPQAEPELDREPEPEPEPQRAEAPRPAAPAAGAEAVEPPFSPLAIDMSVTNPGAAPEPPDDFEASAELESFPEASPDVPRQVPPELEPDAAVPEAPTSVTAPSEAPTAPSEAPGAPADETPERSEPPATATDEEEVMWLGDEFEAAELERPASGWPSPGASDLGDEQLAGLRPDEGWEPDEVPGMRSFLAGTPLPDEEPGSPTGGADQGPPRGIRQPRPGDPDWLRNRHGNAATAYRRLRRLFPG